MKTTIRRGVWETNSSSVHTLSVINESDVKKYPEKVVFGSGEFGWENQIYTNTASKAAYIWEILNYMNYYREEYDECKDVLEIIKKIKKTLTKNGIKPVFEFPNDTICKNDNGTVYHYFVNKKGKGDGGYVDHPDEAVGFVRELADDPKKLLNFLFDKKSWIRTGNDNQDYSDFLEAPDNGPSWEYEKDN